MLLKSPARLNRSAFYLLFSILVVSATLYYVSQKIQEIHDYSSAASAKKATLNSPEESPQQSNDQIADEPQRPNVITEDKSPNASSVIQEIEQSTISPISIEEIIKKPLRSNQVAVITYYAFQTNKKHAIHTADYLYLDVLSTGLTSIASYCQHNGFPFFFRHRHMVDTENKAAYWAKMGVMKHYTNPDFGFEWILWTDMDVLFTNFSRLLTRDWLDHAHPTKHHVALLLECNFQNVNNWLHYGPVRSGFLAVRNSPQGIEFLDAWADSFKDFHNAGNPENTALESMVKEPRWQEIMMILPPDGIHTYPQCFGIGPSSRDNKDAITLVQTPLDMSVHFPGNMKDMMVKFANTDQRVPKDLQDITMVTYDQAKLLRDERVISIMNDDAKAESEKLKSEEATENAKSEEEAKIKAEQQGQPIEDIKEEMEDSNSE